MMENKFSRVSESGSQKKGWTVQKLKGARGAFVGLLSQLFCECPELWQFKCVWHHAELVEDAIQD